LNNVLASADSLAGAAPKLWILDLDRARFESTLSDDDRRRNLTRLYRFVARRDERAGHVLRRTDFVRFFRGYEPDPKRWKLDWRAIAAADGASRAVHSLGWGLEGVFGRSRDPRFAGPREETRS
jgi:hypothetical protein